MANVFPPSKDIHKVYDLKGSLAGRRLSEAEIEKTALPVLKDLNWLDSNEKLYFGPAKKMLLITQIEKDVEFLSRNNIMDYSFLIGIHDMVKVCLFF
jgi:1-phosphatidylinositol-4-phosphate 5-kinase